ncbi:MAG: GntR family transcriptional regulator [Bacilli bacterium]
MTYSSQLYSTIAGTIKGEIQRGVYSDRLPTEKEFQTRFKVSAVTIKTAFALLAEEKLITRIPGKGTFINTSVNHVAGNNAGDAGETQARGDMNLIGVIVPKLTGPIFAHLLQSMLKELAEWKCRSLIGITGSDMKKEGELIDDFCKLGAKGLIIWPSEGEQFNEMLLRLHMSRFPIVLIDRWLPGIDIPCVRSDHRDGAGQAARHLFGMGHRQIAFVGTGSEDPEHTQSVQERLNGFLIESTAHEYSDSIARIWLRPNQAGELVEDHAKWVADRLAEYPGVAGVVAVEPYDMECLRRAAQLTGRSVPEDLSIVGFDAGNIELDRDDGLLSFFSSVSWTWIDQSEERIGREAVRLLLGRADSTERNSQVVIPATLRVGGTTAQPPANAAVAAAQDLYAAETIG